MPDWWWLCPRYFLVDKKWQVCKQKNKIFPEKCYCGSNKKYFVDRRNYLQSIVSMIDVIVIPSYFIKNSLVKNGFPENKMVVVPNGIIKENIKFDKKRLDKIKFGFVGGNDPNKGGHILIEAFKKIKYGKSELQLYGYKGLRGIYRVDTSKFQRLLYIFKRLYTNPFNTWQKFIMNAKYFKNYQKSKYVDFRLLPSYSTNQMNDVYNNMDVLIIPSVMRESFCIAAREALYRNVPVISSDCGGPEEIINDGINGFIFETNNSDELAHKILQILENPSIIDKFIENIDKSKIISISEQAKILENIYKNL